MIASAITPAPTIISGSGSTVTPAAAIANGTAPTPLPIVVVPITYAGAAGATLAPTIGKAATPAAAIAAGSAPQPVLRAIVFPTAALAAGSSPTPLTFTGLLYVAASLSLSDSVTNGVVIDDQSGTLVTVGATGEPDVTISDLIP